MHPALSRLFDEHARPAHAHKRAVHDGLTPLLALAAAVQHQMIVYKAICDEAELADHDVAIDGNIENIRQTFIAIDTHVQAFVDAGRAIAKDFAQIDRYLAEQKEGIVRVLKPKPTDGTAAAG